MSYAQFNVRVKDIILKESIKAKKPVYSVGFVFAVVTFIPLWFIYFFIFTFF
jgi:hypothetical protein